MTLTVKILLSIALILSIVVPFGAYAIGEKKRGNYKKCLAFNVVSFFGTMIFSQLILFSNTALAASNSTASSSNGLAFIGAALATGFSCIGGGIAVASAASAALGAISEDDSLLGKSLIFVGLAEGVALYGLIISFMILSKI
ncbi:V/A-type H+-transporting ATPase subunit K [Lachnospiraceae bacterium RM5]|nr:V/A-type H+-transporting ATPase subunit K [Lachnospiraceae bacterium RM5]